MTHEILQKMDLIKKYTEGLPTKEVVMAPKPSSTGTVIGQSHISVRRIPVSPLETPESLVEELNEGDRVTIIKLPRENVEFYKVRTARGNVGYIPRFFIKIGR